MGTKKIGNKSAAIIIRESWSDSVTSIIAGPSSITDVKMSEDGTLIVAANEEKFIKVFRKASDKFISVDDDKKR